MNNNPPETYNTEGNTDELVVQEREEDSKSDDDSSQEENGTNKNASKKNSWSTDTPDKKFEHSTNWMIIEWLKTGNNYKEWKVRGKAKARGKESQAGMIEALKNDINNAGEYRKRNTPRIAQKIRSFESRLRHARDHYQELLQKPHRQRQDIVDCMKKRYPYYQDLYPVMKDELTLVDIFGNPSPTPHCSDEDEKKRSVWEATVPDLRVLHTTEREQQPLLKNSFTVSTNAAMTTAAAVADTTCRAQDQQPTMETWVLQRQRLEFEREKNRIRAGKNANNADKHGGL